MPSPQDRHSHSRDPRPSLKLKNDRNNEFVIMPGGIVTGHDTPSLRGHSFSKKTFYTPQYCYIWCSAGFSNKQYNRPPHHSLWPLILQITLRFLQWKLLCIRVGEDEARSFRSNLSPSLSLLYAEWGGKSASNDPTPGHSSVISLNPEIIKSCQSSIKIIEGYTGIE